MLFAAAARCVNTQSCLRRDVVDRDKQVLSGVTVGVQEVSGVVVGRHLLTRYRR